MSTSARSGNSLTLLAGSMFATGTVVAAGAFDVLSPLRITQLRSVGVAIVLMALYGWRRRREAVPYRFPLFWMGVVLAVTTGAFYVSIDRLGVGPGATVQFFGPFLVLAWIRVVLARSFPVWLWGAAGVALVGISWITGAWTLDGWSGDLDPIGVTAGTLAAVGFASYFILGEWLAARVAPQVAVAFSFLWSAVLWSIALPPSAVPELDAEIWLALAWIIVVGSIFPFLLELYALQRVDAGRVGVAAMAEPVIAAALAWMWLGQSLTILQVLGGLLVVASVAAVRWVISTDITERAEHLPDLID